MQYLIKNIFKMTEKKYILFFLLFSPIFFNYFFRLLPREERNLSLYNPDIINLFLGLLFFSYLFFIGLQIKKSLNLSNISVAIVLYLLSFFIFDTYFLFITRYFDLVYLFFIINLLWLFLFLYKGEVRNSDLILFLLAVFMFREIGFQYFINNFELSPLTYTVPDETDVWLPATKNIYENNYFIGQEKQTSHSGYGLLISYINSISTYIFSKSTLYTYFPFIKNVFYFLTLFFIYEIKGTKKTKFFLSILLTVVILNSHWFRYLFFNSLMMESGISYFFGVIMYTFTKSKNLFEQRLLSLLLGFLYFGKQFIAGIALLFLIFLFYKKRINLLSFMLGMSGFIMSIINALFLKVHLTWINYFRYFTTPSTGEKTYNFENFYNVIQQFLIDKPITYLLFGFLILFLLNYKENYSENRESILIIVFNTVLVFLLYVFIWGSENSPAHIGSSYRYLLNIFHLLIPIFIYTLDNFRISKSK